MISNVKHFDLGLGWRLSWAQPGLEGSRESMEFRNDQLGKVMFLPHSSVQAFRSILRACEGNKP